MEEKKLVPKLRFPGFTEPWEQRKLGELTVRVKGNDGRMELPTLTISAAEGWLDQHDRFSTNIAGNEQRNYTLLHRGELSYNHGNSKIAKYGVVFVLSDYTEALVPKVYHSFKVKNNNCNPYFIEYYFATKRPDKELCKLISSGARMDGLLNIGYEDFVNIAIKIPLLTEQRLIVECLNKVNTLLTLHQRKLEHLKLKKKSLLQKLFPKEGEVYPELRFPGFTDPWEQRKGDEIFISVSDKGYPQLPVLSASQELGMVYRDENGIDIHHNKSNEDTYKRVLPGQFVIHLRSFQGGFAYSNVEGITSPAYTVITFKNPELYYGLFWKQVFKSLTFIKHLETITYGIRDGRSISFSDFRSLKLCYPTYGEQKFIGDGLEKTDNLITLHQRKLEHLQLLKKALLQQLFV